MMLATPYSSNLSALSTYEFKVEFFEEDFMGTMSWHVLGKRLLRVASMHAQERGFETPTVEGRKYLWVLSRMMIDVERLPLAGECGSITTWLSGSYSYFIDRCFVLRDAKGREWGHAQTVWALIDSETRRPVDIGHLLGEGVSRYVAKEQPFKKERFSRPRIKDASMVAKRRVCYSDLDKNGHLNSIRYLDYALDTFEQDCFRNNRPYHVEVAYSRECYCGEDVKVWRQSNGEGRYEFLMQRAEKTLCQSVICFEPKQTCGVNNNM